jgi:RNA polymerase sigma-70 factor (ECF subfamily)
LERHGPQIRAMLERSYRNRLCGEVDLDDVMQVTYLEAFMHIADFVPAGPHAFGAWLGRIGENNLRDAIRKSDAASRPTAGSATTWEDSCQMLIEQLGTNGTPSRAAGTDEAKRLIEAALQRLPADYERVLRLCDLEGHSGPEAARQIGRSHGAVKMLLARARDRLAALLGSGSRFFSTGA